MRYLTIILLALLTACNVSNTEKEPENKRIGTWEIVSADSAVWIGESDSFKLKTDTLFIDEVGEYGLTLWNRYETNDGLAMLGMYDTTFSYTGDLSDIEFVTTFSNGKDAWLNMGGGRKSFGETGASIEIGVSYNCGSEITGEETLDFQIFVSDSLYKHYRFEAYGFVDTVSEISC